MGRGIGRTGRARAIIAVIALYAFAMQALLGGLMPVLHVGPGGVICLSPTADPQPEGPAPSHHVDCCTAAQAGGGVEAPCPTAVPFAWGRRSALRIAWVLVERPPALGPPRSFAHPRGPPTA